jgi:hypothetical protein
MKQYKSVFAPKDFESQLNLLLFLNKHDISIQNHQKKKHNHPAAKFHVPNNASIKSVKTKKY